MIFILNFNYFIFLSFKKIITIHFMISKLIYYNLNPLNKFINFISNYFVYLIFHYEEKRKISNKYFSKVISFNHKIRKIKFTIYNILFLSSLDYEL